MSSQMERRPIAARSTAWAQALAERLVRSPVTPNQISTFSIVFAVIGAVLLALPKRPIALILAALCIQGRLLCNMLDGMVAVEGHKQSPVGALYNELPDRVADSLFIVGAGYGAGALWLGWLGALLAALTAYVRVMGGALGLPQDFSGIQAKPRRMFVLTVACLLQFVETSFMPTHYSLLAACAIIAVGSAVTCAGRTLRIARRLRTNRSPLAPLVS
jgi:phosphatidylglycerophosphate synthase